MKKNIIIYILGFFLLYSNLQAQQDFRKKAPKAGPAPTIQLGSAKEVTFKNGLKVIIVENNKLPVFNIQLFVDYPPFLEGPSAGISQIAGQLLNKGTSSKTKAEIDEMVDFIGASLSTSANGLNARCLSKHKNDLLEIFTDILFHPSFPEEEFEKLKKQSIAAIAQAKDDPESISSTVSTRIRNGRNHPYGESATEATIEALKIEECKAFYDTHFAPNNSYLIITGDFRSQEVLDLASKYFSQWEKKQIKTPRFDTPQLPEATTVNFVNKPGAVQSTINITYPLEMKPGSDDGIKASLLNTILGGYFGSRLVSNLREDKAYTYSARSIISKDPLIGYFNAYASVRNEVTDSAIVQFLAEIERLKTELVPEKELSMVKNYMTGSFARTLENPTTIANFTLNTARYGLPQEYYNTYLEKLSAITAKDIREVAQKYLTTDQAHILVVGNKDAVSESLLPFSKQGKINFYDTYGNILEERSMPVPEGVTANSIINDYLDAIGGLEQLNNVKSIIIAMDAEVQGVTIESVLYHTAPNKLSLSNKMMGNIISQSIFDGQSGKTINMGQANDMDSTQLADMKIDARLFPERYYEDLNVKTTLKGIELINEKEAYRIEIEYPSGTKKSNYFDCQSKLKIRELDYKEEGKIVTKDISDYKEIDGIKIPHSSSVNGVMPIPLVLKTQAVEINVEISEELFKVE